jgi:choline dehydrogenase-like flavoprotein
MVKDRHPITESFIKSAQEAHYPFTPDYNGAIQEGVGYAQLNQRRRSRWSAADAFLRPALRRKNFRLITNAHVHRLVIKNRRVTGVMYEIGGIMHEASASRIVLCAGAINTPHLLMLSGIGDARELSENGIKVTLDRRAVGKNLMEHPLVRLVYRMSAPTHNVSGALHGVRLLAKYLMRGHGPIACVFESIAFLRSTSGELAPDIQLHVAAFGYDAIRRGSKSVIQMLPYPSMTILVNKNYPVSRGRIRLASASPKALPIIEPRILESEQDLMTLVNGLTTVRRIMAAKPIADLVVEEIQPGTAYPNIESLASYVRDNTEIAYHPAGTCRMGVDDEAVVTPQLQVRGIENLWIADASIMPDLISGNTNAACMMIGVKLGRQLIEMRE